MKCEGEAVIRWTRDNVGEVIPDAVTPLSWSLLEPLGWRAFAGVLRRLGVRDSPTAGLFGRFYGRVYFNRTIFRAVMSRFYPSIVGWRAAPRLALMAWRAWRLWHRLPAESEKIIGAILERRAGAEMGSAQLTEDKLLARLADWRHLGMEAMGIHLSVSVMAELLYQTLDKLLGWWDDGTITAAALVTELGGVRSAEAGQQLLALARQARQNTLLSELVLETPLESLPTRLRETKAGQVFWRDMEEFLAEYGHSATQEFELAAPRWRDDPTVVLRAIQTQVRAGEDAPRSFPAVSEEGEKRAARRATTARIERRLGPLRRMAFRYVLRRAQTLTVARENLKYHFVIAHSRLRDLYLALAATLVKTGRLTSGEDIFFLTAAEITALVEGRLGPETEQARIAERRRRWEADCRIEPPLAIDVLPDGRTRPVDRGISPAMVEGQVLHGFAASPGVYTGRARIVLTPEEGRNLEAGEVLIAPATSPGWTPLFLVAGALVTDIGGTLSHAAIIAREYGLPAVLNVTDATRRIHTGQLVCVDGSQGIVRLLEEVT